MKRTFTMRLYAVTYWVLTGVFVYSFVLFILPELDSTPSGTEAFVAIVVVLGLAFAVAGALASFWRSAPARPRFWVVALVPAVVFLLMNAIYLPYALSHPVDPSFPIALVAITGVVILVLSGLTAYREARSGGTDRAGGRGRTAAAAVWAAVAGAVATSMVATSVGAAGGGVAEAPSTTGVLITRDTAFVPATIEVTDGEVLGLFVINEDNFGHSLDIDALGVSVQLPPNSTTAVAIRPTASGSLTFYCAVPGHREAGMIGSLVVG